MAALAPSQTCTVRIPADLINDIREFLSDSQESGSAAIETFVDKAVRNYLLRITVKQIQDAAAPQIAHLSEDELMDEINSAISEVRAEAACAQR